VNVCRKKQLTNTRAAGSDDALRLIPPKQMSLEQCLEFLADDELLEVTPQNLRLRKSILNHEQRMKAMVMDFGGNDCDFKWLEIAEDPKAPHPPAYSVEKFLKIYRGMIQKLKAHGILPVLTTLPPLEPRRFLNWWCRGGDEETVIRWMGGSVCNVYAHQEKYSRAVERLAQEEQVPLVDIRGEFLKYGRLDETICMDGTHPNTKGQKLITTAFDNFMRAYQS
jgi:lysophospholipase L1-like esterase